MLTFDLALLNLVLPNNELGADGPMTAFSSKQLRRTVVASVRLGSNGEESTCLGHFDDSRQIELAIALRCAGILGIQQARCNP